MPIARDAQDEKLLEIVKRFGWHVTLVTDDGVNPGFAYSTGIFSSFGHPEIIVIGLPDKVGHFVINEYGALCRDAGGPAFGMRYDGYVEGHQIAFLEVLEPVGLRYATWSSWFYDDRDVPYVQLVYPDSETGAFPWEPGYRKSMWHEQPILGPIPRQ